ncbi:MAG: hypothetical protein CMD99_03245 [Gammaproteobacteria bacterium]|nr:hypothetical protein [Gammaproteobacteria bacterium]
MTNQLPDWSAPYSELPEDIFYTRVSPSPLTNPCWVDVNYALANEVNSLIDSTDQKILRAFSGCEPLPEWTPLAQVYSGHQFGQWAGQLGDGRGLYLGVSGGYEWHLKGGGQTPYSRFGDGRSVLRSAIREYLGSEYMHALGIPTTRALALVTSDTPVQRETMERGASLMRLAKSHLRIGHFEHFYHRQHHEHLRELIEFAIHQLDPDFDGLPDRVEQVFQRYIERSAELMGHWMAVGFVHGVMNTDNTALSGETLDYGPYGFLTSYRDDYVINHTDRAGRYAYGQQPSVMHWNLSCLAETLTPFVDVGTLRASLDRFPVFYQTAYRTQMAKRLALEADNDALSDIIQLLKNVCKTPGVHYPEIFSYLLRENWKGLSQPLKGLDTFAQLQSQWSSQVSKDLVPDARAASPSWMLSYWLLDRVIRAAEGFDFTPVSLLREALNGGVSEECQSAKVLGESPPVGDSAYHLSCSS